MVVGVLLNCEGLRGRKEGGKGAGNSSSGWRGCGVWLECGSGVAMCILSCFVCVCVWWKGGRRGSHEVA